MINKKGMVIDETIKWQDITPGGVIYGGGTSEAVNTGDWRTKKPVFIEEKCKQCMLCAPVCPDMSIPVKNSKRGDFNYYFCKGCGICYKVCPFDAIKMENE